MVYDDYADIGIFAKWVMDAPGIGGGGGRIHRWEEDVPARERGSNSCS